MVDSPYLQALFETPGLFVGVLDSEGTLQDANRAALDFIERELEDVEGRKFWNTPWWSHSEVMEERLRDGFKRAKQGGRVRFQADHFSPAGERITVDFILQRVDTDIDDHSFMALGRDITDRRKAEQRMQRYKSGVEASEDSIYMLDVDYRYVFANHEHLSRLVNDGRITQIDEAELLGIRYQEIHPEESSRKLEKNVERVFDTGQSQSEVHRFPSLDRWSSRTYSPVKNRRTGDVEHVIVVSKDITDREQARAELERSEAKFRTIVERSHDAIYIYQNDRFQFVNDMLAEITGYSKEELYQMNIWDLLHPGDRQMAKDNAERRFGEGEAPSTYQARILTSEGEVRHLEFSVSKITYEGEPAGVGAARDVTDRKKVYRQLEESFIQLAETTSRVLGVRDPYTKEHEQRVAEIAREIGERMGLEEDRLLGLYIGGLLHDIGKISIPETILTKPGELTDVEWDLIKSHPQVGYEKILDDTDFPWPVGEMTLYHHERLDGSGYPEGLEGDELSTEVRILGAVDVVEAMSKRRPYREARDRPEVLEEIQAGKGTKYDPQVVEILVEIIEEGKLDFD